MIKHILFLTFLSALSIATSFAQKLPIEPDRPGESESPSIVEKNYVQIESGFMMEKENSTSKNYEHPSILWKYGVNENLEFRLITELVSEKEGDKIESGLKPITVGLKVNLWEEKGIIPTTSFIGHLTTSNLGSKIFHTSYIAPAFRFTMEHELSKTFSLTYNVGVEWDGESPEPTYIYTFTPGVSLSKKLDCFIELYGFAPSRSKIMHSIDGGFTYLLNNNFVVDISGGLGLTDSAPENFISVGFSYRFITN